MHRCGTSLTARLLQLLGFSLGPEEDFLAPKFDNPRGFFEQRPIMEINDAIFEALGGTWWSPPEMPPGWPDRPEIEPLKADARAALEAQFGDAQRWAWKDPRTSLTLPFWRELVPDPRYVVCQRSPADVVASLLRREPETHTPASAVDLWLRYSAEALDHTRSEARLILFYDDLFEEPEPELRRLAGFAGVDFDELPGETRGELEAAIESELRHHRTSIVELAATDSLSAEARALYLLTRTAHLAALAREEGRGGLEGLEPGLVEVLGDFAPSLWAGARDRERASGHELESALAQTRAERDEAVATAAEARAERAHARAAERQYRIALDRALEELEGLRADDENGKAPAGATGGNGSLAQLQAELVRAQKARASIENSLSWRLTRPLRTAKHAALRRREAARSPE